MIDIAKRIWNVALPLTDTAAGRAIIFSSLRGVLKELAKAGVVDGGSVRAQVSYWSNFSFRELGSRAGYDGVCVVSSI